MSRSIVGRRWLTVHLIERTARLTKTLRSAVSLGSVLCTGDLITLDLDGLLCLDQILVQLLECSVLCIDLFVQVTNVLKQ